MKAILLDCEVANDSNEVIELGGLGLQWSEEPSEGHLSAVGWYCNERFRPEKPFDAGAIAVHRILPEDVENCAPSSEAPSRLPEGVEYVVGHNIDFDADCLGGLPGVKRICTLALARAWFPNFKSHKLGALTVELFGQTRMAIELLEGTHNAYVDCCLTLRILNQMLREVEWSGDFEQLYEASENARVPKIMPFGKHKGMPIEEVPFDYKDWLLRQPDVDPYLVKALTKK